MPEIQLPLFQGPLDLLLRLIERDDLDITAISLVAVTDQYLSAIREDGSYEPQALAEFVAIGAKLIYLKSRALLPPAPGEGGEGLEDDDVGRELVDMLVEYRRFMSVFDALRERQDAGLRLYPRMAPPPPQSERPPLDGVTMDALQRIMVEVLQRIPEPPRVVIRRDTATLAWTLAGLRERLRSAGRFSFREAIRECRSRVEVVLTFLAVLELLKASECEATQDATWSDIEVVALAARVPEPVG